MDFNNIVEFVESYSDAYFRQLAHFLRLRRLAEAAAKQEASHPWTYTFISAAIGVLLQSILFSGLRESLKTSHIGIALLGRTPFPNQEDILIGIFVQLLFWISMSVFISGALRLMRGPEHYSEVLALTLGVFPFSFVIGAFAGLIFGKLALLFLAPAHAPWVGFAVSILGQVYVVGRYLPRAFREVGEVSRLRTFATTFATCLVVGLVNVFALLDSLRTVLDTMSQT